MTPEQRRNEIAAELAKEAKDLDSGATPWIACDGWLDGYSVRVAVFGRFFKVELEAKP